jgi:hypothetical protein
MTLLSPLPVLDKDSSSGGFDSLNSKLPDPKEVHAEYELGPHNLSLVLGWGGGGCLFRTKPP